MSSKYNYVLFHHPCNDGFLSLALLQKFGFLTDDFFIKGTQPDLNYLPPNIKNKRVIIVDLNLKMDLLLKIISVSEKVLFIDHHINKNDVHQIKDKKFKSIYDKNKSASRIIWEHFYPKKKLPHLIRYIDDNDRMANIYEETSKFISAYEVHYNVETLLERDQYIEKSRKIIALLENKKEIKKLLEVGKYYMLYKYAITKKSINNFESVNLLGPDKKNLNLIVSNVGGFCSKLVASQFQMFDSCDLSITWYYNVSFKGIICICRSKKKDITWLLRMNGSEGHPKAGTFKSKFTNIYDWIRFHNDKIKKI